jgi:putative DNA primase/helicase
MIHALTDIGNATRLIERHGNMFRYHLALGFLLWDTRRWAPDPEALGVQELAIATAKSIYGEVEEINDPLLREALTKWARTSQGVARVKAMLELARSNPAVLVTEVDSNPYDFNVVNGTLDLKKRELRPHRQSDLITKLAHVVYDREAKAVLWEKVVARALAGDPKLIGYFRRLCGYSITGSAREQVIAILWGKGANGKTTLVQTVVDLAGDYARACSATTFEEARGERIPSDIARLTGVRLVNIAETQRGGELNEGLVKSTTGGESIVARFLYRSEFEYKPQFTPLLQSNHKPRVDGIDEGIWRRIHLLPFTVRIPDSEQDKELLATLRAESSGILNWVLDGCTEWQQVGLNPPASVRNATEAYRRESDSLADFVEENIVREPAASVTAGELYRAYRAAAEANSEKPVSKKTFGLMLSERGFERSHSNGTWYEGIRLRTETFEQFMYDCEVHGVSFQLIEGNEFGVVGQVSAKLEPEIKHYRPQILMWLQGSQNGQQH